MARSRTAKTSADAVRPEALPAPTGSVEPNGQRQSIRKAAEAFAQEHNLPSGCAMLPPGVSDGSGDGDRPVPDALNALLQSPEAKDISWWCAVARSWRAVGCGALARASASKAWDLVMAGATAAWDELQALADMLAAPDDVNAEDDQVAPWRLDGESAEAKQARIGQLFGRTPQSALEPVAPDVTDEEDIERLIISTKSLHPMNWPMTARIWHRARHHRLTIDHFFMTIAGNPLQSWLVSHQEALVWCGWAFHRVGDQATAYACFRLALALEDEDALREALSKERTDPNATPVSEAIRSAVEYLDRYPAPPDGMPGHEAELQPRFVHYARLAEWLEERGLEGYLVSILSDASLVPPGVRSSAIALPLRAIAQRSGWHLETMRVDGIGLTAAPPAAGRRAAMSAAPVPLARALTRTEWAAPPTLPSLAAGSAGSPNGSANGAAVTIGVAEAGGQAVLPVNAGEPMLLVGVPGGDKVMSAIAEQLAARGWLILWAYQARLGGPAQGDGRWDRLAPGDPDRYTREFWLREMVASIPLQRATLRLLEKTLDADIDPAAPACIEAVIKALDSAADILVDGRMRKLKQLAADIVDGTAGLTFEGPGSLRRAALLHDLTLSALIMVRRAIQTEWTSASEQAAPHGPLVAVELADDADDAAMTAILTVGSLLRAIAAYAALPEEAEDSPGDDLDISIRPRPPADPEQLEELKELENELRKLQGRRPAAEAPAAPSAGQPADEELLGSPWTGRKIVTSARRPLCVLVSGSLGGGLESALEWFGPGGCAGQHSLVTCIPAPDRADFRTAHRYETILAGAMTADQRALLAAGVGGRMPADVMDSLGAYGAVHVPAGALARGHGSALARLIIPRNAQQ